MHSTLPEFISEQVLANTERNRSLGVVYLGQGGQLSNGFLHKYVRKQYSFTVISTRYSGSSMREMMGEFHQSDELISFLNI